MNAFQFYLLNWIVFLNLKIAYLKTRIWLIEAGVKIGIVRLTDD